MNKKKKIVNREQKDKYTKRKEVLTSFFLNSAYKPLTKKEIAVSLDVPKSDLGDLERILADLSNERIIFNAEDGRYKVIDGINIVKCTYPIRYVHFFCVIFTKW